MARLLLWILRVADLSVRPAILIIVLLLLRLLLLILLLCLSLCRHDAVVVLGMLQIVLGHHPVAGRIGIARQLEIFLVYVGGRTANFDLGAR